MKSISQHILEKLKVSSANVSKLDFDMFAKALYNYCVTNGEQFDLEYLDYYKGLPNDEFPWFDNPSSILDARGYIRTLSGGMYQEKYIIHIFYVETPNKKGLSVTTLNNLQFDVLTNAIEPAILQEIYDYLIDNA